MADVCTICRGKGTVEVEDAAGAPRQEVPCPYCKGRKTLSWVGERRAVIYLRYRWREIVISACMWGTTYAMWANRHWTWWWADPSQDSLPIGQQAPFPWHHVAFWACWVALFALWTAKRHFLPAPNPLPQVGGKGFTTDRERASLVALAAGLVLKNRWDHRHDR